MKVKFKNRFIELDNTVAEKDVDIISQDEFELEKTLEITEDELNMIKMHLGDECE